jgi:DeoR family glycerol-3-phosphate regulon repressor
MKRETRFQTILSLLDTRERVNVEELALHFDVSPETIRRDLSTMSEQGLLRKIYGGAVKFQSAQESSFALRTRQYAAQKTQIARYATRFIKPGDSLFLNSGTTTEIFARELVSEVDNLIVITNSPTIAHLFWDNGHSHNTLYLLGGSYNAAEVEISGTLTVEQIQRFHADHAFLTVGSVNATQGFMDYRVDPASINQAMAAQSQRTTVLVDSSKLDRMALITCIGLAEVDQMVTDCPPSEPLTTALQKAGTQLYIAGIDPEV